jgi:HSP20 family protein
MANIVRKEDERGVGMPALSGWDPFRLMCEMMAWDPFRAFDEARSGFAGFAPQFDVKENGDGYLIEADLPGVEEKDLEVTLTGNRLTISGKREAERSEDGTTWYTYERSYGSFSRTFTLPEGVDTDRVDGELKNGVLTVHLPKRAELKPRKISIKGIIEKVKSLGSGDKAKV